MDGVDVIPEASQRKKQKTTYDTTEEDVPKDKVGNERLVEVKKVGAGDLQFIE